ncbi:ATP-dependent acyl-CoA ligase [Variovorax sp. DT-64]|uniref:ATP-dependent acyl-CoA ligase n=1 Tax=Variovorax sp. DT-64 TaxID=3396160 RepID=UPI003F1970E4
MTPERPASPLPPAQRTLPAMLERQAGLFEGRPLLRIAGRSWTHSDARQAAGGRAAALAQAGVQRGDRVALMSGNRIEFLEVFLGCGWLGAAMVPINTASMGPQIEYFLQNSEAKLLVIEAAFVERLLAADLARTLLREIWVLGADAGDAIPGVRTLPYPAARDALPPAAMQPGDSLAILYTSGTTGPAKGVVCPHAQYYWWGVNSADVLGVGADDVLCTTLPLFHINALNTFAQAALTGCEVVFEPRFSASGFWPSMRASGATVVYLLGAMVPILLAQPEGPGERDHRVRVGLGPGVPESAARTFLERTGVRLLEGYGSTETNFAIATAPDSPRGGVMGWLRPGFQARVADEDDVALPDGEAGELLLRADEPHAFASGYFNMPEKTVEAWRNLWFHTGDRVVREADGAFRFVDRIKDAIRRRGENISSFEVEQVLLSHPGVAACAVYPVHSELAEDEVMAALVAREGQRLDPAELLAFCETRLPYFALPRYVDLLPDLPRTENGKVQKYKLRERGVTAATWDRGPGGRAPAKG